MAPDDSRHDLRQGRGPERRSRSRYSSLTVTAAARARTNSWPVASPAAWATRLRLCAPSRPRARRPVPVAVEPGPKRQQLAIRARSLRGDSPHDLRIAQTGTCRRSCPRHVAPANRRCREPPPHHPGHGHSIRPRRMGSCRPAPPDDLRHGGPRSALRRPLRQPKRRRLRTRPGRRSRCSSSRSPARPRACVPRPAWRARLPLRTTSTGCCRFSRLATMFSRVIFFMWGQIVHGRMNSTSGNSAATLSLIEHSVIMTTRSRPVALHPTDHARRRAHHVGRLEHIEIALGVGDHLNARETGDGSCRSHQP